MNLFEAFLYGVVQGITEYLPISSSAHLILLPKFLGKEDPGLTFDVFLHIGTLLSTLVYFWKDWLGVFKSGNWKWIAVATVPALVAGALLNDLAETVFRSTWVLVITLSFGGLALYLADSRFSQKKSLGELGLREAVWIGCAQCLALVPGMSRSGSTIMAGRILGFDRASAARFSFLISAPITGAAIVFKLRHWNDLMQTDVGGDALILALVSSFVFGCIAIGGLLRLVTRFGYGSYAVYRVLLAVVIWKVLI